MAELGWSIQCAWGQEFLLLESGDFALLEDGSRILLEEDTAFVEEATRVVPPLSIIRGRNDQFSGIQAGKLTFVLENNDGRFDPWNVDSALYPAVLPRTRVQVHITTPTDEYITNGGFESGTTGWTDLNATLAADPLEFNSGAASLSVTNTTVGGAGAYQDFVVTPGDRLTFTGYKKRKTVGSTTRFAIRDNTNSAWIEYPSLVEDTGWTQYSYTFTVPDGCVSIRVYCRVGIAGYEAYFDTVSLTGATYNLFTGA